MNLLRVRRLAEVLLASELRSGRSRSDPRSLLGRPVILAVLDAVLFLGVFGVAYPLLNLVEGTAPALVAGLATQILVFLPVIAVATVLLAGVMFEFSTTARVGASDAANWLPISPTEYVAASSTAVAFVYSPAPALALGGGLAIALVTHALGVYLLAAALTVVALYEGAFLIEMLRSATPRASAVLSGRTGKVALLGRAVLLIVVILAFQLLFNPIILLQFLGVLTGFAAVTSVIPLFWSTQALLFGTRGAWLLAAVFVVAQLGFVGFLLWAAARLRVRFWAPAPAEVRLEAHRYGEGHRALSAAGLSPAEAALVAKDLTGFTRRRELLPMLVTPVVIALLLFLESAPIGGTVDHLQISIWTTWSVGFFALMVSLTSIGQERRSIFGLFAFPLTARSFLRAKAATAILLSGTFAAGLTAAAQVLYRPPVLPAIVGLAVALTAAAIGTLMGLSVATRYPDFQERPRPQFVRPWAMLTGLFGGFGLIFLIAVPATLGAYSSRPFDSGALALMAFAAAAAAVSLALLARAARSGAERLAREIPA